LHPDRRGAVTGAIREEEEEEWDGDGGGDAREQEVQTACHSVDIKLRTRDKREDHGLACKLCFRAEPRIYESIESFTDEREVESYKNELTRDDIRIDTESNGNRL